MRKFMFTLAVISGSLAVAACNKDKAPSAETANVATEDASAANAAPAMATNGAEADAANMTANSTGEAETAGSNGGPDVKAH